MTEQNFIHSTPPQQPLNKQHVKNYWSKTCPFFPNPSQNCFNYLTISNTLQAWWKANNMINFTLSPCTLTPPWQNPDLWINNQPIKCKKWRDKGITHLHHLFTNNLLSSYLHPTPQYHYQQKNGKRTSISIRITTSGHKSVNLPFKCPEILIYNWSNTR